MANDKLTWVELRKVVAETANISEQEAGQFLNALLEAVMAGLKADKQVKIKGIGTFALKAVAPRKSVNIATGETITIEGYNKLTFNAESVLKENVEKRLEQPKTEAIVAELSNDPIKKLGEQADEIIDILAELGQAVTKSSTSNVDEEKIPDTQEVLETIEEPISNQEPTSKTEVNVEVVSVAVSESESQPIEAEEAEEKEKEIAIEKSDPVAVEAPMKPACSTKSTCKCHKWICWVIFAAILLGSLGVGIYFRATLMQWWQCMQDCRPAVEEVVAEDSIQVPIQEVVVPLAEQPREYVNFIKIEKVGKDSRLAWIAYKYYGQKDLWVFIYEANRDVLDNPSYVRPGQYLRIPELDEKYRNLYDPELKQLVDSLATKYLTIAN